LPHWEADAATYFVTFRLHDSLPTQVLTELADRNSRTALPNDTSRAVNVRTVEKYLDRGCGDCYLRDPAKAKVVQESILWNEDRIYRLIAWAVMPNHVHIVFRALLGQSLGKIVQSLKSFMAKKANELLGRTGSFWQREYYDRLIRDDAELDRAVRYVLNNPENAGLVSWNWVGSRGPEAHGTAGETPALQK
jgi:REP element-mobilizing transposase RayT